VPPAAGNAQQRNGVLAGLVGAGGARRAYVDATGASVPLPPAIRRLVATDDEVGALLVSLGAPIVGSAGTLDDVVTVGASRSPDPRAVAALRPDLIVTGVVDRTHDVAAGLVTALRQVSPVVAVEAGHGAKAVADLRALLGQVIGGGRPATEPVSDCRVGAP
jgi:ABC-type Fe2+-enterobactin transport system substrate-binding protein